MQNPWTLLSSHIFSYIHFHCLIFCIQVCDSYNLEDLGSLTVDVELFCCCFHESMGNKLPSCHISKSHFFSNELCLHQGQVLSWDFLWSKPWTPPRVEERRYHQRTNTKTAPERLLSHVQVRFLFYTLKTTGFYKSVHGSQQLVKDCHHYFTFFSWSLCSRQQVKSSLANSTSGALSKALNKSINWYLIIGLLTFFYFSIC